MADTIQKLFDAKAQQARASVRAWRRLPPRRRSRAARRPPAGPGGSGGERRTGHRDHQLIPDERTNKLIVVASPAAYERIDALLKEIDVPISGEGRINVYYLRERQRRGHRRHAAVAGPGHRQPAARRRRPGGATSRRAAAGRTAPAGVTAAELFQGEVKISADKATNSLVVVASQSDYRNLVRVIEKLDIARRQVFVEAVIMEVNLDRNTEFGDQPPPAATR